MIKTLSSYYSPFGSTLPTRSWSDVSRAYRYGFNGKEKDSETANDNYDFGARIYDGRLGRWLSLDPLMKKYPEISSFTFVNNSVLILYDIDGRDIGYSSTMNKNEFAKSSLTLAMKSTILTNLINKFGSTTSGDIKTSSSGTLSRHKLEFNKKRSAGGEDGSTNLYVKVGDNYKIYKKGMDLPANAEFKVQINLHLMLSGFDEKYKGTLAETVAHELIVHAEKLTKIIEEYDMAIKAAGIDNAKIVAAQDKLKKDLDTWQTENNENSSSDKQQSKAHEDMENGKTNLGKAVNEITKILDEEIKTETDSVKKQNLTDNKEGINNAVNDDIKKKE